MLYPIQLSGIYNDDVGYRAFIRKLCSMEHKCPWDSNTLHEIDEVSLDEYDYDDNAMTELLDNVFSQTHSIPVFNKLYTLAAATMMSEDTSIGVAVLFSYSFASIFHNCIVNYITTNSTNYSGFAELLQILSK